jgi:uncharacterized membrane protein YeaQ/YmgE (transglycosylase-associated protein family)
LLRREISEFSRDETGYGELCEALPKSMTLTEFLLLLAVAGICGALGQAIAGYSRGGCIGAIAVGFVGALLGVAISRWLHLPELFAIRFGNVGFPIVWSVAGSALFVALLGFLNRRGP